MLEVRPERTKEAHAILKRTWPRVDYATAELAFAHYLDATTVEDAPNGPIKITVAPLAALFRGSGIRQSRSRAT